MKSFILMNHVRYREADRTGEESFMKYDLEHYRQYLIECEKAKIRSKNI